VYCHTVLIIIIATYLAEANSSQAPLLLERLLLGKFRGKQMLVVGKPQSGKAALMQCITATFVTQHRHDDAIINSIQIHTPGKENSKCLPKGPIDAIILCIRLDDHFRNEDQQLIVQLGSLRRFGKVS
jgi:hypothetical protein